MMSVDKRWHASLAATARWTAAARSEESTWADGLFNDPWAAELAGEEGQRWLSQMTGRTFGTAPMIIRTRYFDDFLQDAVVERGLRQVVLLAAGLDTRAYRLEWLAGSHLFELDQPEVLQYKAEVLAGAAAEPICQRTAVAVDLAEPWGDALLSAGFDKQLPAVWLLEGFLYYIFPEQITPILDRVATLSAPASRLGFDIINEHTLLSPITHTWVEMQARQGAPWIGWLDDPQGFLVERGWEVSLTQPGNPDANYGRWKLPLIPLDAPDLPHNWYVTATKK